MRGLSGTEHALTTKWHVPYHSTEQSVKPSSSLRGLQLKKGSLDWGNFLWVPSTRLDPHQLLWQFQLKKLTFQGFERSLPEHSNQAECTGIRIQYRSLEWSSRTKNISQSCLIASRVYQVHILFLSGPVGSLQEAHKQCVMAIEFSHHGPSVPGAQRHTVSEYWGFI